MHVLPVVTVTVTIAMLAWFGLKGDHPAPVGRETKPVVHAKSIDSKIIMQMLVSVAILASSLYIILSKRYAAQDQHWAYASAGTILGFWLRGK